MENIIEVANASLGHLTPSHSKVDKFNLCNASGGALEHLSRPKLARPSETDLYLENDIRLLAVDRPDGPSVDSAVGSGATDRGPATENVADKQKSGARTLPP